MRVVSPVNLLAALGLLRNIPPRTEILPGGVTVARVTLDHLVQVQILAGQFENARCPKRIASVFVFGAKIGNWQAA